jgi:hypothetical protein
VFYPPSPQSECSKVEKRFELVKMDIRKTKGGMEDKTELDFTAVAMGILLLNSHPKD